MSANTAQLTLANFLVSERVKKLDATLFHVKDETGRFGLFDTSKGLIILCVSHDKLEEAEYGFWSIETENKHRYLFNPTTEQRTSPTPYYTKQINADVVLVSNESSSQLIDLAKMRVYSDGETLDTQIHYQGFEIIKVHIPSIGGTRVITLHNETFVLFVTNGENAWTHVFIMDMRTGQVIRDLK